MRFIDITNDQETTYRLGENEQVVFVMENRDGETAFELTGAGAEAHVFASYSGTDAVAFAPKIVTRHLAPETVSRVTIRARLSGSSSLRMRSLVEIVPDAARSDASEDIRVLLLSPETSASAVPELEIATDDVTCMHSAVIAPPDPEQLHYLATRGISETHATKLLADGLFKEARERLESLGDT